MMQTVFSNRIEERLEQYPVCGCTNGKDDTGHFNGSLSSQDLLEMEKSFDRVVRSGRVAFFEPYNDDRWGDLYLLDEERPGIGVVARRVRLTSLLEAYLAAN